MSLHLVELKKRCPGCGVLKSWDDYYASERNDDGSMRRPQWKCKSCANAYRVEQDRLRMANDPEYRRRKLEQTNVSHRRARLDPDRGEIVRERERERARRLRATDETWREREKERKRRWRESLYADPQRLAAYKRQRREQAARRRLSERGRVTAADMPLLGRTVAMAPFREWLRREVAAASAEVVADRIGISTDQLDCWFRRTQRIPEVLVDHAGARSGVPTLLADLYPDEFSQEAA